MQLAVVLMIQFMFWTTVVKCFVLVFCLVGLRLSVLGVKAAGVPVSLGSSLIKIFPICSCQLMLQTLN